MATSKVTIDWKALGKDLTSVIGSELPSLLEGASEDLQKYGAEIVPSLARSIAEGKENVTIELRAQLRGLAEVHRIRANDVAWATLEQILTVAMRTAKALIGAATGSVLGGIGPALGTGGGK